MSLSLKLRLLDACVMSVMTCSAESWTLTTEIEKKIDACENRWLRLLLRINYKDRITNREIRERTKMIQLSNRISRMQMKWTGHILRMSDIKTVKQVFRWEASSRRSRGRPMKRWMDCAHRRNLVLAFGGGGYGERGGASL